MEGDLPLGRCEAVTGYGRMESGIGKSFLITYQVVFRYSRISRAAVAPSPKAEATCFVLPERTSPAAKMPGMLVSRKEGSLVS